MDAKLPSLIFIGSHLGYPMDRTPLGGGAMVGLHLARLWAASGRCRIAFLGSGTESPAPGATYARMAGPKRALVEMSEWAYARFCRDFERQTTDWVLSRQAQWPSDSTVVVVNDLSEGPDLERLTAAGYAVVSIWHVDVVDYFNRMYLKGYFDAAAVTPVHQRQHKAGLSALVPDVLKLVFDKQRDTVAHSDLLVLPSSAMKRTIERCYPQFKKNFVIQAWGALDVAAAADAQRVAALKKHYQMGADTTALLTLSRISPEKGIDRLLEALLSLERSHRLPPQDMALFVCGEAAFMQGRSYLEKVRGLASRLRRVRCFFPGYIPSQEKAAFFSMVNLFVSASLHESYGLTIVEAMSAGLPVLASDHYGVRDILDKTSGVIAAPETFEQALASLLGDRKRLAEMGRAASSRAATMKFSDAANNLLNAALGLLKIPAGTA